MKTILNFFLRGMLIVFPVGATIYLFSITIGWVNESLNYLFFSWFDYSIPGLGIITGFVTITLLGFVFTRAFTKPIVHIFEKLLSRTPLVSIIYSSLKDLTEAFVGDKKKFTEPVMIDFGVPGIKRLGFITQHSLLDLGLEEQIAVYCPHSYNFSGNLYIVDKEHVQPIKKDPATFMKFVVSGGVSNLKKVD
tara:strand:+ start:8633 stop:9208 length:576 start_codon:yes stop_codon:yes gene_type:complete